MIVNQGVSRGKSLHDNTLTLAGHLYFAVAGHGIKTRENLVPSLRTMSASTPQRSTTLGNYSFAHNPPTPHSNQHNTDASFGSSPPVMGGSKCASQMLGPNDHSSSASSQHILTTSDSMRAVVPMMADTNVVLWMPNSPSSRNAILHGSPYNSPTPHDLGGAGSRTSSHPATGRVYLSPRSFPIPGPIGHTLPMCSQCSMTTSDMHSVVPMMENPNAASWIPNNLGAAASLGWPGVSQFVPYLHELGGARSGAPSHLAIGSDYSSPQALQMPGPIGHTLPEPSQCGMTASDIHSVVHMTTNSNAVSRTPNNLRTSVSLGPSQSVSCVHDLEGVHSGFRLLPSSAQSELPIKQLSLLLCRWVHNNAPCGYDGTLEDLKQHWYDDHLPGFPGAMIQCQWERCNYHRRGDRLMNVMRRCSVWRHISEVHLMYRRNS
ncbi:hypothetical protein EV424DRAFT_1428274 [Suillus variegatus]|nr:hypothetical protein EV424DRAFT_1428274 [Suillus variegatus]